MELKFIEKLLKLVNEQDIDSFEYSQGEEKLRIIRRHPPSRGQVVAAPAAAPIPVAAPEVPASPPAVHPTHADESQENQLPSNVTEITSPMVGTFYRAPAPDADPYIKVGDSIQVGQVLCIIEAMKLMNELQSEYSGKIVEILAKNAQPVEFGQPLFLLETE